jgi:hypothetical protein
MCEEYCGDRGFLWRSVGLGDVVLLFGLVGRGLRFYWEMVRL